MNSQVDPVRFTSKKVRFAQMGYESVFCLTIKISDNKIIKLWMASWFNGVSIDNGRCFLKGDRHYDWNTNEHII